MENKLSEKNYFEVVRWNLLQSVSLYDFKLALEEISQNLTCLIKNILDDEHIITKNSSVSQIHRLGFDKFNFVSKILSGSFTNNLYERCKSDHPNAFNTHEYLCNPVNTNNYDSFEYLGVNTLVKTQSIKYNKGDTYHLDNEQFHTTEPGTKTCLTATLFLRTKNIKERDTIFEITPFSQNETTTEVIKNINLTPNQYKKRLVKYLATLQQENY